MQNKEEMNEQLHGSPCFFAFLDEKTSLYWMIPISLQVRKYQKVYNDKKQKYCSCDTIAFTDVLGHTKAFLIQNMCSITMQYVKDDYIDNVSKIPVRIDGAFEKKLIKKAKKILALHRTSKKYIFPNVQEIESKLLGTSGRNN